MKGNGKTHRLDALFVAALFIGATTPLPSLAGTPIPDPVGFGDDQCWSGNTATGTPCFSATECTGSELCDNKNRYISFTPPSSDSVGGELLAIRVKLVDLPGFPEFNGEVRWVGAPADYPLARDPSVGAFKAAQLECEPHFMDWGEVGLLHVVGSEIVPVHLALGSQSTYEVQTATADCLALGEESCFSPAATITTTGFGDVVSPFGQLGFADPTAVIDTFGYPAGYQTAKNRAQLALPVVSPADAVTMLDLTYSLSAFQGYPYPTPGPFGCPRPFVGCGDGLIIPPEECDDNNTENGDGCDATCRIEERSIVVSLKPVSPTASLAEPYPAGTVINDNEIILPHGEVRVFLELTIAGWDPEMDSEPLLGAWQVTINDSGYSNGVGDSVGPALQVCTAEDFGGGSQDCEERLGPNSRCICPPPGDLNCAGSCESGFSTHSGTGTAAHDFVQPVDQSISSFRFASHHLTSSTLEDPGTDAYAGTLALDIPEDALGTFVIGFLEDYPHTFITEYRSTDGFPPPFLPIAEYRPAVITVQNERNRYLTFAPPTPVVAGGEPIAIRAKIIDAPQFPAAIGQVHWAGVPTEASDGIDNPAIMISQLQCEPAVRDWSDAPLLSLYGQAVVPGSTYEIRTATAECLALGVEECLSEPIVLRTAKWGDAFAPWGGSAQPNFGDVSALLDKFRGLPTAPSLTFTDLTPDIPNQIVNFADVSAGVDAFRGIPYSFAGPQLCDP
jgi:cysteine-rich repeat protein